MVLWGYFPRVALRSTLGYFHPLPTGVADDGQMAEELRYSRSQRRNLEHLPDRLIMEQFSNA